MVDPRPLGIRDVRVTRRAVNHRGDWVFLELTDSDGRRGLGEASHSGDDEAVVRLLAGAVGEQVRGTAWAEPPEAWRVLDGATPPGTPRRVSATAASAVEQALWDLAAQREGVGLAALLGASAERVTVPLYANINRATVDRSPDGFAASATQAVRDGFRIIKLAPFDEVAYGTPAAAHRRLAEPGIARVAAVREAVGAAVRVLVDCHWRFDVASALEVADALGRLDVGWLEDPVPYEDGPADVAAVRRSASLPIATGERLIGAVAFDPFLAADAADYYLPDIKHIGGIGELLELARASRDSGARITPHNPSGPISTLASACALAGVAHAAPLEFAWGEVAWRPAVLTPPELVEDGALVLPVDWPGLGARLSRIT
ncbi:MAG: mandelate racemase/muconate lactonizing enzyme family protein [Dehalococcoidia bacterium]|jgi:galactonate dehydratase|nr:mandelate racemase/muconate lactonizing enzyme family protein [Dehalococcoidia bacterium]